MTREQQITVVKEMISEAVADGSMTKRCATAIMNAYDAILALPLNVPKKREINATAHRLYKDAYNPDGCVEEAFKFGMKTAIDEIIKRNRP